MKSLFEVKTEQKASELLKNISKENAIKFCQEKMEKYMILIQEKGFLPLDCNEEMVKLLAKKYPKNKKMQNTINEWNKNIIFWSKVKHLIKQT